MVQKMQPDFHYKHAEAYVSLMESFIKDASREADYNVAYSWSNPLMVLVFSVDILYKLKDQFRSLSLRIDQVSEELIDTFI